MRNWHLGHGPLCHLGRRSDSRRHRCPQGLPCLKLRQPRLKHGHALGKGVHGYLALGPRDAREGQLENKPLVGGCTHLAGRIA